MKKFFETWPKYVKVLGHHDDALYLVTDRDQFIDIMLKTALQWLDDGDFGQEDWYYNGTYYDYFKLKMGGMSEQFFNEHILSLESGNTNIDALQKQGLALKELYKQNKTSLSDLKFVKTLKSGKRPSQYTSMLYAILQEHTLNGRPRFVVNNFDN